MKKIVILFLVVIMVSCKSANEDLLFVLKNKSLNCVIRQDSLEQHKYLTNSEREKSTNVISIRLTNNTNKKYLFLINGKDLQKLYYSKINIYENDKLIPLNSPIGDPIFESKAKNDILMSYMDFVFQNNNRLNSDLFKLGAKNNLTLFNSFLEQSVVINPNESRVFNSILKLPYVTEDVLQDLYNPSYFKFNRDSKYSFSLEYHVDVNELKKQLTMEQLEELKYNEIEIFENKIETQRIPIVIHFL